MKKSFNILSYQKVSALAAFALVLFFVLASAKNKDVLHSNKSKNVTKKSTSSVSELKHFDCLGAPQITSFGCSARGVDQATLTVRSDGTYDFSVHYCCNISPKNCSNSGRGRPTGPGQTKHAEWSINQQGCLAMTVQQLY